MADAKDVQGGAPNADDAVPLRGLPRALIISRSIAGAFEKLNNQHGRWSDVRFNLQDHHDAQQNIVGFTATVSLTLDPQCGVTADARIDPDLNRVVLDVGTITEHKDLHVPRYTGILRRAYDAPFCAWNTDPNIEFWRAIIDDLEKINSIRTWESAWQLTKQVSALCTIALSLAAIAKTVL